MSGSIFNGSSTLSIEEGSHPELMMWLDAQAGVTSGLPHPPDMYRGSRDLNSGPFTCTASTNNLPGIAMLSHRTQSNVLE